MPTRDIHMNQVHMERQWLYFLQEFIMPVQKVAFMGYNDSVRLYSTYYTDAHEIFSYELTTFVSNVRLQIYESYQSTFILFYMIVEKTN